VEVDGKEVRTTRGLPVSNKRLAGVQPGGIGRVDSAGIETVVGSVSVERIEQKKKLENRLALTVTCYDSISGISSCTRDKGQFVGFVPGKFVRKQSGLEEDEQVTCR
jgi:hypothetical protein